jgi:3-methyl-2-oxobutanoate hydroxymethyltransferase
VTPMRIPELVERKKSGKKIAILTAYDATMARLMESAGIDAILVGDSLGNVIMGYDTTLPVTLDDMVRHTRAVRNGARNSVVIADMPFLTFSVSVPEAVRNAGRLMQEGGATAVKLEGGAAVAEVVERLVEIGIPVMGHVGLTPQSVHKLGGFRRVGKTEKEAEEVIEEARILEEAGAFAVVLEAIPAEVARVITERLSIPTIGIGAGPHCDGQVLVCYDVFGLYEHVPAFVKRYADLGRAVVEATAAYVADVQEGRFPELKETPPRKNEPAETRG